MAIKIEGYLLQSKLEKVLQEIVGDKWRGKEVRVLPTRCRWDMSFEQNQTLYAVEFDGDSHYRDSLRIKVDREKDEIAAKNSMKVVRIPYWVQLNSETFKYFFDFDAEIETDFPHGFIESKIFPASYCELGMKRFNDEISKVPESVKKGVISSLRNRIKTYGHNFVVPSSFSF